MPRIEILVVLKTDGEIDVACDTPASVIVIDRSKGVRHHTMPEGTSIDEDGDTILTGGWRWEHLA